jgi:hypothetical protein
MQGLNIGAKDYNVAEQQCLVKRDAHHLAHPGNLPYTKQQSIKSAGFSVLSSMGYRLISVTGEQWLVLE